MPTQMEILKGWLRRGLGRAVLFLQQNEAQPYRDIILHACLHNLAYDPQFEGNRARYIFDVIQATGETDFYAALIRGALATTEDEDSQWQLFDLCALLARAGEAEARRVMYETFARHAAARNYTGADALIELDGLDGFRVVLTHFARHGLAEDKQWYAEVWLGDVEEQLGEEKTADAIQTTLAGTPELAAMVDQIREQRRIGRQQRKQRAKPPVPTYEELRGMVADPTVTARWLPWRRYGRMADEATIQRLADDLLAESDRVPRLKLLHLFHDRRFSGDHAQLLILARSLDVQTAEAARQALSHIAAPDVRALALELIATAEHPWQGVDMLRSNYHPGDYHLLENLAAREWTADEMHSLGISIRRYVEANPAPDAAGPLLRLYQQGPCSTCRCSTVELLQTLGPLPSWMQEECRYDADQETRKLVAGEEEPGTE